MMVVEPTDGFSMAPNCSRCWWHYGTNQQGCHFSIKRQAQILSLLPSALKAAGASPRTVVSGPEENNIGSALETLSAFELEHPEALDAIGLITTHTYGDYTENLIISKAYQGIRAFAAKHGKRLWQSEMGNGGLQNDSLCGGGTTAARIELDLKELQPSAWTIWQV